MAAHDGASRRAAFSVLRVLLLALVALLVAPSTAWAQCDGGACVDAARPPDASTDVGVTPDESGPRCGDLVCNGAETCSSCAMDCGACRVCGDGVCLSPETCGSCPIDCRPCAPPDAGPPDVIVPDVISPDVISPDVISPDVISPDVISPDVIVPDVISPDVISPDVIVPDVISPDVSIVDRPVFDVATDLSGPDVLDAPPTDTGSRDVMSPPDVPPTDTGSPDVMTPSDAPPDAMMCTMPPMRPSTPPPVEVSYAYNTPPFFGIGISYTFAMSFMASAGADMGMCTDSMSAGGSAEVCGQAFGQVACVAGMVSGSGECTMPQVCRMAPTFSCDESRRCCAVAGTIGASVSRGFVGERDFGPFSCEYDLRGTVGASIAPGMRQGPGCACQPRQLELTGRVTLGASGGGACSIKLFGATVGVGVSASVCANGGVSGRLGCGLGLSPVGGAGFQINFPRIRLGWITISPTTFSRSTGTGC